MVLLTPCLPIMHLQDLDFTAAFASQGKVKPFEIMLKNPKYQTSFCHLCESLSLSNADIVGIEKFVCAMYGKLGSSSVSNVRYRLPCL